MVDVDFDVTYHLVTRWVVIAIYKKIMDVQWNNMSMVR
jgi:hypothetical protein